MNTQKLHLKNRRGQNIVGLREVPENKLNGTAIIQHGHGQHMNVEEIQIIKNIFLKNNIQTIVFDTTNSGNSSDGEYEDSRVGLHADDFEDVAEWVQEQIWFQKPLFVVGKSLGGYSAIRYAEHFPEKVSFVIAIVPFISGYLRKETIGQEKLMQWKKNGFRERKSTTIPGLIRKLPWKYITESLKHDLLPKAEKLTMPILLLAGENDKTILLKHVEKFYEKIPGGNKTFIVLEKRGHDFRKDENDKKEDIENIIKAIDSWIKKHLNLKEV